MTKAQKLFLSLFVINSVFSIPVYLNSNHENFQINRRRLLPFNPDPGGNVTCAAGGDPVCGTHGVCVANWLSPTNWTCQCNQGWFTRQVDALNLESICSTKQPSFLTALLLQIFLGWISVGALYLGWTIYATIPFMVMGGVLCIYVCIFISSKKTKTSSTSDKYRITVKNDDNSPCINCLIGCLSCGLVVAIINMWVLNLVLIVNNCYNKEGIPCTR